MKTTKTLVALAMPVLLTCYFASTVLADGKWQSTVSPVPTTYDAGEDPGATGDNTHPVLPKCTGLAIDTTQGVCVGAATAGDACDPTGAPCAVGICQGYTATGIGVTDAPNTAGKRILTKKSQCAVKGTQFKWKIAFEGDGTAADDFSTGDIDTDQNVDITGNAVAVCDDAPQLACVKAKACVAPATCLLGANAGLPCDAAGDCPGGSCTGPEILTCVGGANDGSQCTVAGDCPSGTCSGDGASFGPCISGDEYWAQLHVYVGSNVNQSTGATCIPSCIASADFPPGGASTHDCIVGTCTGGSRSGQPCDTVGGLFAGTCPSGTCSAASTVATPDVSGAFKDEAVLNVAGFAIQVHCPFEFALSFPFEVKKGKGKGKESIGIAGSVIAARSPVEIKGCFIHDKAGARGPEGPNYEGIAHTLGLGVFVPPVTASAGKEPCPSRTLFVDEVTIGSQVGGINTPVSPILGVSGLTSAKIECGSNADCSPEVCCGGGCFAACP